MGRVFGRQFFSIPWMPQITLIIELFVAGFLIYIYLAGVIVFENLSYVVIASAAYSYFRTSSAIIYYIVKGSSNAKIKNKNEKEIGAILNNSVYLGYAFGNVFSNCLPFVKEAQIF